MDSQIPEEWSALVEAIDAFGRDRWPLEQLPPPMDAACFAALRSLGLFGLGLPEACDGLGLELCASLAVVRALARFSASAALVVGGHSILAAPGMVASGICCDHPTLGAWARGEILAAAWLEDPYNAAANAPDEPYRFVMPGLGFAHEMVAFQRESVRRYAWSDAAARARCSFEAWTPVGCENAGFGRIGACDGAEPMDSASLDTHGLEISWTDWAQCRLNLMVAFVALGLCDAAMELGCRYVQNRRQFGKPLAAFQACQWKIADAQVATDAAALLAFRAGMAAQNKGETNRGAALWAAMACSQAVAAAVHTTDAAVQLHGGMGVVEEQGVSGRYRDALALHGWTRGGSSARAQLGAHVQASAGGAIWTAAG